MHVSPPRPHPSPPPTLLLPPSHAEVLGKLLEVLPECPSVKLVVVYGARPHQRLPDVPSGHCKMITLDR